MFEERFWSNGPAPGALYSFPGGPSHTAAQQQGARKHTLTPITTGTSVLGVKFDGGVVIAADMLGSYGSLARFRDCERVMKVNETTVLGAGGDFADFQHLRGIIEQQVIDEQCMADGFGYTPKSLHSWITRVMYNRRTKFDPLWNTVVVGGLQPDGEPFLGYVDKIGIAYDGPAIASGFGQHMAMPMMRKALEQKPVLSEQEAVELLDRCLKVLFYRDARSFNKYQLAIVTKEGSRVQGPISSDTNWDIAHIVKGF